MTPVYGPDGTEYPSYQAAIDAGVQNPSYIKPTTAPKANVPTYGYELQRLMQQYGVQSPVAPRTTDQALVNQYFQKLSAPMYDRPQGNALFNQYLGMGLGELPSPAGPMTRFFPGQPVAPAGYRFDPVTATNVPVTAAGGVAEAGRITTGTPNIGGNQCPPGFTFDPATRSCIPGPDTGLLTGGQSISAQQPMPTCPPGYVLDPANRTCVPQEVAEYTPPTIQPPPAAIQPPPPPTQTPVQTPVNPPPVAACPPGYEADLNNPSNCVPSYQSLVDSIRQSYSPEGSAGAQINKAEARAIFDIAKGRGLNVPQLGELVNTFAPGLNMTAGQLEEAIRWAAPEEAEAYLSQQKLPTPYDKSMRLAKGGAVDMDKLVKKYQIGGLNRIPGFNEVVMGQQQPDPYTPPMFIEPGLREMMDRYDMRPEQMIRSGQMASAGPAIQAPASSAPSAREQYDQAAARLRSTIQELSSAQETKGPSKAEMYFRLASAFGTPGKTGSFFENLGAAGQVMSDIESERRAATSASAATKRDLALELAKFDVERAQELMQSERDALKPLSEYGRIATDEGLPSGSAAHRARVRQLQDEAIERERQRYETQVAREERLASTAARQASRMTATETRQMQEAESGVTSSDIAIEALTRAIELSPTAYTKARTDRFARAWAEETDPDSPKVVATREMEQLITTNVLNSLKVMFGGNPTEGERAIALATQGIEAVSTDERGRILESLLGIAQKRRNELADRVERIQSGEYTQYEEGAEDGE